MEKRHCTQKADLLEAAARLARELTTAQTGYLYLRSQADPHSEQMGESVHYQLLHEFNAPWVQSSSLESISPSAIEAVGSTGQVRLVVTGHRHLLVPFHRRQKIIAVLDLCKEQECFDETDVHLTEDLVAMLDTILQDQHLTEAHTALLDLSQNLRAELNLNALLTKISKAAANIAYAQASSILLFQPEEQALRFAAAYGLSEKDRELLRHLVVPIDSSIAGSVVSKSQSLISNDVAQDPRFYSGVSNSVELKTRSLLAVPMVAQDKTIGALEVINQKYDDGFDEADIEILNLFASQAAIAIQNARLLAERQASLTDLRKLEQRKSQFIALASHELRTPLNLVSGYTTLLRGSLEQENLQQHQEAMDSLGQIEHATNRLIGMVNNITSMYNLETGRTQLLLERRNVVDITQKVLAEHKEWCSKKGIVLTLHTDEDTMFAVCDAIEVNRILGSLVSNAVKFTPEGGRIRITVTTAPGKHLHGIRSNNPTDSDRRQVLVPVSDTGPGIDPGQFDTIFERFAQVDNHLNRLQGGIGLGLPLAKALVEKHGGQLWVDSEKGNGTTFHFTLPASRNTTPQNTVPEE